jgi:hypothetical protein
MGHAAFQEEEKKGKEKKRKENAAFQAQLAVVAYFLSGVQLGIIH